MLRHLALFPCIQLLSGIANAGQVSGTANVELDNTNIEMTYGWDNGGKQASHMHSNREPGQQPTPGNRKKLR